MLAAGLHGYLLRRLAMAERFWCAAAALMLIDPNVVTDLIGYAMVAAAMAHQYATRTKEAA
jgi:TRAP-type uncharacterized transport system fused permease subunit